MGVREETSGKQSPWYEASIDGDFYFNLSDKKKEEDKHTAIKPSATQQASSTKKPVTSDKPLTQNNASNPPTRQPVANPPSVSFVNLPYHSINDLYLNGKTKMIIGGNKDDRLRKSLTPISVGKHYMDHFIYNNFKRASFFEVQSGENVIDVQFTEYRLPFGRTKHIAWKQDSNNTGTIDRSEEYIIINANGEKIKQKVELTGNSTIKKENEAVTFNYKWTVTLNGNIISKKSTTEKRPTTDNTSFERKILIYKDDYHYYYAYYKIYRDTTTLEIRSEYIEFLETHDFDKTAIQQHASQDSN